MFSAIFFRTFVSGRTSTSRLPGAVKEGIGIGASGFGDAAGAGAVSVPAPAADGAIVRTPAAAATTPAPTEARTSSRVTRPPIPDPRICDTSRLCSLASFRTAGERCIPSVEGAVAVAEPIVLVADEEAALMAGDRDPPRPGRAGRRGDLQPPPPVAATRRPPGPFRPRAAR